MKKIVRLTESDLARIVKRVIMESKFGDVKPLLNEGDLPTNTKNCGWGTDSKSYEISGWMCPKSVPIDWSNYPCVPSHPSAKWTKNHYGQYNMILNGVTYFNNGRKGKTANDHTNFTCKDPEFANIKILGVAKYEKPKDAPQDVKAFQDWVINTKKDTRILGTYGADGNWGPRTQTAWDLYKKEFNSQK